MGFCFGISRARRQLARNVRLWPNLTERSMRLILDPSPDRLWLWPGVKVISLQQMNRQVGEHRDKARHGCSRCSIPRHTCLRRFYSVVVMARRVNWRTHRLGSDGLRIAGITDTSIHIKTWDSARQVAIHVLVDWPMGPCGPDMSQCRQRHPGTIRAVDGSGAATFDLSTDETVTVRAKQVGYNLWYLRLAQLPVYISRLELSRQGTKGHDRSSGRRSDCGLCSEKSASRRRYADSLVSLSVVLLFPVGLGTAWLTAPATYDSPSHQRCSRQGALWARALLNSLSWI